MAQFKEETPGIAGEVARTGTRLGDYLRSHIFMTENIENPEADLADLTQFGIEHAGCKTSFFIPTSNGQVGAWYLEPETDGVSLPRRDQAVLYLHGVKGTRARSYRVGVYNILLKLGFKVLTIDYRGFGDSTDVSVDEETMVEDGVAALSWLRRKEGAGAEILVFAHSLGCAVAAHALTKQHGELSGVSGVILMAPFNNFLDEALWKLDQTSSWVKYYLWAAVRTVTGSTLPRYLLQQLGVQFNTDQHLLSSCQAPLLILHAEDDDKIPVELARKLVEDLKSGGKTKVSLHIYDKSYGYQHHDIYKAENLPTLILDFTSKDD